MQLRVAVTEKKKTSTKNADDVCIREHLAFAATLCGVMLFVTVATHAERYFGALLESCRRYKCQLIILGWGQRWRGFRWRQQLIAQWLTTLPEYETVVVLDAFDSIVLRDASTLETQFKSMNVPVLFSTEKDYASPLMRYAYRKVYGDKCSGANVCAGLYMGYVWALRRLFNDIQETFGAEGHDDQQMLYQFCRVRPQWFDGTLDRESRIFLNVHGGSSQSLRQACDYTWFDIDRNMYCRFDGDGGGGAARLINIDNGLRPYVLHGPGNVNLNSILSRLHLPLCSDANQGMNAGGYWCRSFVHFVPFFRAELLLMLTFLLVTLMLVAACYYAGRFASFTALSCQPNLPSPPTELAEHLGRRIVHTELH